MFEVGWFSMIRALLNTRRQSPKPEVLYHLDYARLNRVGFTYGLAHSKVLTIDSSSCKHLYPVDFYPYEVNPTAAMLLHRPKAKNPVSVCWRLSK